MFAPSLWECGRGGELHTKTDQTPEGEKVILAFISSLLDCYIARYAAVNHPSADERFLLPGSFRVDLNVLLFVFKLLNGLETPYLSELLHLHTPSRSLRSSDALKAQMKAWLPQSFGTVDPSTLRPPQSWSLSNLG